MRWMRWTPRGFVGSRRTTYQYLFLSLKESPDFGYVIQKTINYGSSIMYHIFENSDNDELREAAKVHREVSKLCSILPGRDGEQNDERATNERAGERVGG